MDDVSDASRHAMVDLILRLAMYLRSAVWLSKDIVLFFHPCCQCACRRKNGQKSSIKQGEPRRLPCISSPLWHFLSEYHLTPLARSQEFTAAALHARRAGVIRQIIAISQSDESLPHGLGEAADDEATRQHPRPMVATSIEVSLAGRLGRLPNLDLYAALWRVAAQSEVRIPLELPSTRPYRSASPGIGLDDARRINRPGSWSSYLDLARGAISFAGRLAWGEPQGGHSAGVGPLPLPMLLLATLCLLNHICLFH